MERRRGKGAFIIKQFKPFITPVLFLILIDQFIKMVISKLFMQYEFDMVIHLLKFNPERNINLSWFGNFVDIFSSLFITVLLNTLAIFIFVSGYLLYKAKTKQTSFSVKIIMTCGLAGCFCSLIDKLFWGGSLDFLQIPNFFVFDIKDSYLTVAEVVFVIVGILHSKEISVKEYLRFCCNKFRL